MFKKRRLGLGRLADFQQIAIGQAGRRDEPIDVLIARWKSQPGTRLVEINFVEGRHVELIRLPGEAHEKPSV